jgi:hypothetical protein
MVMGIGRAAAIIALIALPGCSQDVAPSAPPEAIYMVEPIESDVASLPPEKATIDERQPATRSPVDYD